jgi:hypothetical protein
MRTESTNRKRTIWMRLTVALQSQKELPGRELLLKVVVLWYGAPNRRHGAALGWGVSEALRQSLSHSEEAPFGGQMIVVAMTERPLAHGGFKITVNWVQSHTASTRGATLLMSCKLVSSQRQMPRRHACWPRCSTTPKGVVPPAPVVRDRLRFEHLQPGHRILCGSCGPLQKPAADQLRHIFAEHRLPRVGFTRHHQNRMARTWIGYTSCLSAVNGSGAAARHAGSQAASNATAVSADEATPRRSADRSADTAGGASYVETAISGVLS